MQSCITAHKLSAGYNGRSVFRDLDIDIPAGKITTLIGSN
ncbi:MAG TPA: ABC transporter ATP-binding protein, partial [Clostridium sp.]|nr:ABC transporter ATP-binding protein [Clostridium sp.]